MFVIRNCINKREYKEILLFSPSLYIYYILFNPPIKQFVIIILNYTSCM